MNIQINKRVGWPLCATLLALQVSLFSSCTDTVQFGDSFLEKAPGGTVTADTVFNNAEYTRQFLSAAYAYQYYNLPSKSSNASPQCLNYWKGMPDALGDTHQLFYNASKVFSDYYSGALSSTPDTKNTLYQRAYLGERAQQLAADRECGSCTRHARQ